MTKTKKVLFGGVAVVYAIAFAGALAPAFAGHGHAARHILHDVVGDGDDGHHNRGHHDRGHHDGGHHDGGHHDSDHHNRGHHDRGHHDLDH